MAEEGKKGGCQANKCRKVTRGKGKL